ncbi:hypothetical protein D3C78_1139650 [compost metagenome]
MLALAVNRYGMNLRLSRLAQQLAIIRHRRDIPIKLDALLAELLKRPHHIGQPSRPHRNDLILHKVVARPVPGSIRRNIAGYFINSLQQFEGAQPLRSIQRSLPALAVQIRQPNRLVQALQIIHDKTDIIYAIFRTSQLGSDFHRFIPCQLLLRRIRNTEFVENVFVVIEDVLIDIERKGQHGIALALRNFFNIVVADRLKTAFVKVMPLDQIPQILESARTHKPLRYT